MNYAIARWATISRLMLPRLGFASQTFHRLLLITRHSYCNWWMLIFWQNKRLIRFDFSFLPWLCFGRKFTWLLHGECSTCTFYDLWNISFGGWEFGGYFSTTKNSWMHSVAIQAKGFHRDNYSLLHFSRLRWFTCMLRFQAVCRFVASWCKQPTLCLTPAYCM